jgi:hypothetical protein
VKASARSAPFSCRVLVFVAVVVCSRQWNNAKERRAQRPSWYYWTEFEVYGAFSCKASLWQASRCCALSQHEHLESPGNGRLSHHLLSKVASPALLFLSLPVFSSSVVLLCHPWDFPFPSFLHPCSIREYPWPFLLHSPFRPSVIRGPALSSVGFPPFRPSFIRVPSVNIRGPSFFIPPSVLPSSVVLLCRPWDFPFRPSVIRGPPAADRRPADLRKKV